MIDAMGRHFHVTSVLNRDSIAEFGLDTSRMAAARGIAGSHQPEADGCFLVDDEWDANWFVRMNNTGGAVDVWAVDDVDESQLLDNGSGYYYLPGTIPRDALTLIRTDIPPGAADIL